MRRIGVLISTASDDPVGQARVATFLRGLRQLGWTDGRNMRIDTRWASNILPTTVRNQCSEAEFDPGGHTAFGGAMKHLIVGMSDSSWVIQIW